MRLPEQILAVAVAGAVGKGAVVGRELIGPRLRVGGELGRPLECCHADVRSRLIVRGGEAHELADLASCLTFAGVITLAAIALVDVPTAIGADAPRLRGAPAEVALGDLPRFGGRTRFADRQAADRTGDRLRLHDGAAKQRGHKREH